jgi:uncharacterized protein (TIGR03435 family)
VGTARSNGPGLWGLNATMPLLAKRLSDLVGRPIIDHTGLDGAFDFDFDLDRAWDGASAPKPFFDWRARNGLLRYASYTSARVVG